MKTKFVFFTFNILLLFSCQEESQISNSDHLNNNNENVIIDAEKYKFHNTFSQDEKDTLLTNLASFIIKKPAVATWETKFDNVFRPYYIENRNSINIIYLSDKQNNDYYYYYLLREARNVNGVQNRGVGGKYKLDIENFRLIEFEEMFNTPILDDEKLIEIGYYLIDELVKTDDFEKYKDNKSYVEWPDGRLFYSKEKFEWRYID